MKQGKGFKLAVMIPAFNEQETIGKVIKEIPKRIEGIDKIQVFVIDDGSTDETVEIAKKVGAVVISHEKNKGLGIAFKTGLENALKLGADIIVNIDADMQFNPKDIPKLIGLIQKDEADMVTASRFINHKPPKNMPFIKRFGNKAFTILVNQLTGKKFTDTQCGFRAYSRETALRLNLFGEFTYTQEAFLDLVNKGMRIKEVPIEVKYNKERKSKIVRFIPNYALSALTIILRTFRDYHPLRFFAIPGFFIFLLGFFICLLMFIRWVILHATSPFKSLILVGIAFIIIGMLMMILALIADMLKRIRHNQEEILYRLKENKHMIKKEKLCK